ncbi:hypothetical protein HanRHA438_Chr07g0303321 [Helianthus annuus]|nr:hypothetical protein HanRHA438_Chr07g0303321 [Helianthus annuus]
MKSTHKITQKITHRSISYKYNNTQNPLLKFSKTTQHLTIVLTKSNTHRCFSSY